MTNEWRPDTVVGGYVIREALGQGRVSLAYLVHPVGDPETRLVLKVALNPRDTASLQHEADVLRRLQDLPSVVELVATGSTEVGQSYLVTELVPTGTRNDGFLSFMDAWAQRLDEAWVLQATVAVLKALSGMHARGVEYADLKPEPFLWNGTQLKIFDFNLSVLHSGPVTAAGIRRDLSLLAEMIVSVLAHTRNIARRSWPVPFPEGEYRLPEPFDLDKEGITHPSLKRLLAWLHAGAYSSAAHAAADAARLAVGDKAWVPEAITDRDTEAAGLLEDLLGHTRLSAADWDTVHRTWGLLGEPSLALSADGGDLGRAAYLLALVAAYWSSPTTLDNNLANEPLPHTASARQRPHILETVTEAVRTAADWHADRRTVLLRATARGSGDSSAMLSALRGEWAVLKQAEGPALEQRLLRTAARLRALQAAGQMPAGDLEAMCARYREVAEALSAVYTGLFTWSPNDGVLHWEAFAEAAPNAVSLHGQALQVRERELESVLDQLRQWINRRRGEFNALAARFRPGSYWGGPEIPDEARLQSAEADLTWWLNLWRQTRDWDMNRPQPPNNLSPLWRQYQRLRLNFTEHKLAAETQAKLAMGAQLDQTQAALKAAKGALHTERLKTQNLMMEVTELGAQAQTHLQAVLQRSQGMQTDAEAIERQLRDLRARVASALPANGGTGCSSLLEPVFKLLRLTAPLKTEEQDQLLHELRQDLNNLDEITSALSADLTAIRSLRSALSELPSLEQQLAEAKIRAVHRSQTVNRHAKHINNQDLRAKVEQAAAEFTRR